MTTRGRISQIITALMLLFFVDLSGCANTESSDIGRSQSPPPGMNNGGRSMRKGAPPERRETTYTEQKTQTPSEEAFAACEGKLVGDFVTFIDSRGKTISAICREDHDHLVAIAHEKR